MRKSETEVVTTETSGQNLEAIEKCLMQGDLAPLTIEQRLHYVKQLCASLGLNYLTQPFQYIVLNNKLTLYCTAGATNQIRDLNNLSVEIKSREIRTIGDQKVYEVTVELSGPTGRCDSGTGCVNISGLKGDALSNAMMKAETKAKRRGTLQYKGLSFLDESEIDSVPNARVVGPDGKTKKTSELNNLLTAKAAQAQLIGAEQKTSEVSASYAEEILSAFEQIGIPRKTLEGRFGPIRNASQQEIKILKGLYRDINTGVVDSVAYFAEVLPEKERLQNFSEENEPPRE